MATPLSQQSGDLAKTETKDDPSHVDGAGSDNKDDPSHVDGAGSDTKSNNKEESDATKLVSLSTSSALSIPLLTSSRQLPTTVTELVLALTVMLVPSLIRSQVNHLIVSPHHR